MTLPSDKEMILARDEWPAWPMLPIKKPNPDGGMPECALLFDHGGLGEFQLHLEDPEKVTVYRENMAMLEPGTEFKDMKQAEYANLDAMLEDGWIVD